MLIDSLKFSRHKHDEHGTLPIAGFDRLRDSLFALPRDGDVNTNIIYEISGGVDARERPVLRLKIAGHLLLPCQRCLKALDYDLTIDTVLRLVPEAALDAEMSDDPDEPDCIVASAELDLTALIEDELLMALPAYPRHEDVGCNNVEGKAGTSKLSAFSVLSELSALKKHKAFKLKE